LQKPGQMQDSTIKNEPLRILNLSKGKFLAFSSLYYQVSGRFYFFTFRYLKSKSEREELVKEVFTKIWEKRADLKEEHE